MVMCDYVLTQLSETSLHDDSDLLAVEVHRNGILHHLLVHVLFQHAPLNLELAFQATNARLVRLKQETITSS